MATIKRTETSNVTWKEVLEIINSGKATEKLKPGTESTETLKDGSRAVIAVAAVDLYQNGEVIFCFRNTVGEDHRMNKEWTNKGGWKDCKMREYLNSEILALLPDELVEMLSPKKTIQIQNGSTLECEDLLFLPSEYEVHGEEIYAKYNGVDKQFPFYKERTNRIVVDEDGDTTWRWLASPYASTTTYFCIVTSYGDASYNSASYSFGVAPGFAIRKS